MWICNCCKYVTQYKKNLDRHYSTLSHEIIFKKHKNRLNKKIEREKDKMKNDIEINEKLTRIEKQQIVTDTKINIISKEVKRISDYVQFLNKYCSDADPLTLLTEKEVDKLLKLHEYKKYKFENMIIDYMKCDKLHTKIGDLILETYLNSDNLTKQKVWVSDITYIGKREKPCYLSLITDVYSKL